MTMATKRKWKIQVVKSSPYDVSVDGDHWWHLREPNGEIVAHSESYSSEAKARKTAKRVFALLDPERVSYEEIEE